MPQVKSKKVLGVILQENFNFNDHVDHVKSKALKALSAFSPLMSYKGGAPAEVGVYLYTSCIRHIIESAFPVWCTIGVDSYKKLEEVQRTALRYATGTRFNTSLSTLEAMTKTPPIRLRLEERLVCEITRILSTAENDPVKVLFIERMNDVNFMKEKRLSVIHIAKPLFRDIGMSLDTVAKNIEIAASSQLPPSTVFPNIIEIDDGKWGNSGNRSSEQIKNAKDATASFLQLLPKDTVPVFTDGSALKNPGPCGASAVLYRDGLSCEPSVVNKSVSLCSTSFHGELVGLDLAVESGLKAQQHSDMKCLHIFCDCRSAIKSVSSFKCLKSHNQVKTAFLEKVAELKSKHIQVNLTWVAGHVDLIPNEIADVSAKDAALKASQSKNLMPAVTKASIKAHARNWLVKRWNRAWSYGVTGRKYCELHPHVECKTLRSQLPCYLERLLLRLRSFNTDLRGETLWKASLHEDFSALCECGMPETYQHVLLDCPLLEDLRTEMEIQLMKIYSKYDVPSYQRTVDLLTMMGAEDRRLKIEVQAQLDFHIANFLLKSKRSI